MSMEDMKMKLNAAGRVKVDGVWYEYIGQVRWGKMYFSFDFGNTWAKTKKTALEERTTA